MDELTQTLQAIERDIDWMFYMAIAMVLSAFGILALFLVDRHKEKKENDELFNKKF